MLRWGPVCLVGAGKLLRWPFFQPIHFWLQHPHPGRWGVGHRRGWTPQGLGEQNSLPGVLSWGLGRESAINAPLLFAPAKEPVGASRNTGANTVCAQREGFHATAITGAAVAGNHFLAVETWQRKLPVRSPTCCAAAPGWGGSGALPGPSCHPPAEWGALFPSTALPYLICTLAPSDAQWGDFCPKKWVKQCREAHGAKAVSDAPRRFEEELGRELSAGRSDKGALVPRGGDAARATAAPGGAGWVGV